MVKKTAADQKKNKKNQAKDLVRIIEAKLAEGDAIEARALYESISKLGRSASTDNQKARAAHKLIHYYVGANDLEKAQPLLQALARRSENLEVLALMLDAMAIMSEASESLGLLDLAQELRQSVWEPAGWAQSDLERRSEEIWRVLEDLRQKNRLDEVLRYFEVFLKDPAPERLTRTVNMAVDMTQKLFGEGRRNEAAALFDRLSDRWDQLAIVRQHLAAGLASLIQALAFDQDLTEALAVYAYFERHPEESSWARVMAAADLADSLVAAGRVPEALALWLALPLKYESDIDMEVVAKRAAKTAELLMTILKENGEAQAAKGLFEKMAETEWAYWPGYDRHFEQKSHYLLEVVEAVYEAVLADPDQSADLLRWAVEEAKGLRFPFESYDFSESLPVDFARLNDLDRQKFLFSPKCEQSVARAEHNKAITAASTATEDGLMLIQRTEEDNRNDVGVFLFYKKMTDYIVDRLAIGELLWTALKRANLPTSLMDQEGFAAPAKTTLPRRIAVAEAAARSLPWSRSWTTDEKEPIFAGLVDKLMDMVAAMSTSSLQTDDDTLGVGRPAEIFKRRYLVRGYRLFLEVVKKLKKTGHDEEAKTFFSDAPWLLSAESGGLAYFTEATFCQAYPPAMWDERAITAAAVAESANGGQLFDLYGELLRIRVKMTDVAQGADFRQWAERFDAALKKNGGPPPLALSRALSMTLKDFTMEWLLERDLSLLSLVFETGLRLARDPSVMYFYFLAVKAYIEGVARRASLHGAFDSLEKVSGYLSKVNLDDFEPEEGQKENWISVALVNVLDSLVRREIISIAHLKRIDYDLTFLIKHLKALKGGLSCRLLLAKSFATILFLIADSNSLVFRAPFKAYFEYIYDLVKEVSTNEAVIEFVRDFWADCIFAYMTILVNHSWLEEAIKLYDGLNPLDVDNPFELGDRAQFMRRLIVKLERSNRHNEALIWLQKLTELPLTPEVEAALAWAVDELAWPFIEDNDLTTALQLSQLLDRPNPCERAIVVRVGIVGRIIGLLCRDGQLEEALNLYQSIRDLPLTQMSYNNYVRGLCFLMDAFGRRGETATAAHLFVNRATMDLKESTRNLFKSVADRLDPSFKTRPSKQLAILFSFYLDLEEYEINEGPLARNAVALVEECLAVGEEKRALSVYRAIESLRHLSDNGPTNHAALKILEVMLKTGRESEADALAKTRSEKLPPGEALEFRRQYERLPRPSAAPPPLPEGKAKAKAR
ncbi:MAG: hypothetical protein LBE01_03640 [Deltaproteobacteria bacterium]|jgi:hypothetical protein|nr:hypothetical protein [Deltaproteobacteria bacterium]